MRAALIVFSLFAGLSAYAENSNLPFAQQEALYKQACGGKIYSDCDTSELSQTTLFDAAVKEAKATGKKVYVQFGYDRCPYCKNLHESYETAGPIKKLFEDYYVYVHINVLQRTSARALMARLNFPVKGVPTGTIYDPETANVSEADRLDDPDIETGLARALTKVKAPTSPNGSERL